MKNCISSFWFLFDSFLFLLRFFVIVPRKLGEMPFHFFFKFKIRPSNQFNSVFCSALPLFPFRTKKNRKTTTQMTSRIAWLSLFWFFSSFTLQHTHTHPHNKSSCYCSFFFLLILELVANRNDRKRKICGNQVKRIHFFYSF